MSHIDPIPERAGGLTMPHRRSGSRLGTHALGAAVNACAVDATPSSRSPRLRRNAASTSDAKDHA